MRNKVVIAVVLLLGALWLSTFLPSLGLGDHTTRQERATIIASQNLKNFHLAHQMFAKEHSKAPSSMEELVADGHYLDGVVEPHRTRILKSLTFPYPDAARFTGRSAVLATYTVDGANSFFLLSDGSIGVEESGRLVPITNHSVPIR